MVGTYGAVTAERKSQIWKDGTSLAIPRRPAHHEMGLRERNRARARANARIAEIPQSRAG